MLSKKTKYAIHALVKLAREYGKGPVLISEIAQSENIPKKFLEAILLDLRNNGFLSSKKGKNGGYYLLREPDDINLADVIRLFDGAIALLPCVTYRYYEKCNECVDETTCGIRNIIQEVRDVSVKILKKSTLSEIIRREEDLKTRKQARNKNS